MINSTACHLVILLCSIETGLTLHNTLAFVLSHFCFPLCFQQLHVSWKSPFFLHSCTLCDSVLAFVDDRVWRKVLLNDSILMALKLFIAFYRMLIRLPLCLSPGLLWTLSKMVTWLPFFQLNNPISLTKCACIYLGLFFFSYFKGHFFICWQ